MIYSIDQTELEHATKVLLEAGSTYEVRTTDPPRRSGYFTDPDALMTAVERLQTTAPQAIYITLNPVKPDCSQGRNIGVMGKSKKTTADDETLKRRWLPMDFDPDRETGISATDAEHDTALEVARETAETLTASYGFPSPIIADSGNGAHLLYRIDLPNDKATDTFIAKVYDAMKVIFFNADGVKEWNGVRVKWDVSIKNSARIWKLYGTWACKGKATEERPHRLSRLLEVPDEVSIVSADTLTALVSSVVPPVKAQSTEATPATETDKEEELDLPFPALRWGKMADGVAMMKGWITRYLGENAVSSHKPWNDRAGRVWEKFVLRQCPFNPDHNRGEACIYVSDGNSRQFNCRHNSCSAYRWKDLVKQVGAESPSRKPKKREPSDAQRVMELLNATEHELFRSTDKQAFISLTRADTGRKVNWTISSPLFANWLRVQFMQKYDHPVGTYALRDSILSVEATAMDGNTEYPMFLRTARQGNHIYIDLANDKGEVAEVSASGWQVITDPPVKFYRTQEQAPLPVPQQGGSIYELEQFINVDKTDFPLVIAYLCDVAKGEGEYQHLCLTGPHGSGKTTTIKKIGRVIDPLCRAETSAMPHKEEDITIAAVEQLLLRYENVSRIPEGIPDALCRVATGSGVRKRKLFTDKEMVVFNFCRSVIMDGITDNIHAPDLLDRTLLVQCPRLTMDTKNSGRELDRLFVERHPFILGALLDLLAQGLRNADMPTDVREGDARNLDNYDFMYRCSPDPEAFSRCYSAVRQEAQEEAYESSTIAALFVEWAGRQRREGNHPIITTPQELHTDFMDWLALKGVKINQFFPSSAKAMTNQLKRLIVALERKGWYCSAPQRNAHRKLWTIEYKKPADPQTPPLASYNAVELKDDGDTFFFAPDLPEQEEEKPDWQLDIERRLAEHNARQEASIVSLAT